MDTGNYYLFQLIYILWSALKNTSDYYKSIFGNDNIDHMNIFKIDFKNIILTFSQLFIPKLPISPPDCLNNYVKLVLFGDKSRYIPSKKYNLNPEMCILFINGISGFLENTLNTVSILENKLQRPVNLIYNSTNCLVIDLLESAIGKQTSMITEPSLVALQTICQKILNPDIKKVVIISYSQGTIIIAKVLQNLKNLGITKKEYLEKLEIYAFANCATNMNYVNHKLPYIESLANNNDIVCKLGCNHSKEISRLISIDGNIFVDKSGNGHFFIRHYLNNFSNKFPKSNLLNYFKK